MSEFNHLIGVIGCGFVGGAMVESMTSKGLNVKQYDKYKNGGIGILTDLLDCTILFLCLPTPYSSELKEYDKSAIFEICEELSKLCFTGLVVIKSTIEIGTSKHLHDQFGLNIIHNPEFLSVATALHDVNHQVHVVLGKAFELDINNLISFYEKYYDAPISICDSNESESMKLFCNSFYATKVQFFTEMYSLCEKVDLSFNIVRDLMVKNGWINPQHTNVPGSDGQISYGGYCFVKDTNALNELMKRHNSSNAVLDATIKERATMRKDNLNCF